MTARKILQNSIWSLRRKLVIDAAADVPVALRTQPPGYSLDVALDRVDLHLFHQWVREGRSRLEAGEPDGAATLLSDALELWRGPALADLTEVGLLWPELTMLQSMRLDVLEDLFEAQLVCGRHYAVLGELESLVENEPLRERACGQLMRALYRCGRQSDALGVFSRLRARLVEELGLEPSRELQQLQQAILTHDTALQLAPAPGGPYSVRGTAALLLGAAETASQPHGPRPVPDSPAPASPRPPLQSPASPPQHAAPASVLSAPVPTLTFAKSPLQRNGAAPRPDGKPPASTLPPVQGSGPGPQRPALRAVLPAPVTTPAPKTPSPVVGSVLRNDTATVHVPVPGLPTAGGGAPTAASAVRREASLLLVRAEPDPASTDAGELDAVMDGVGTLVHQEIERCGGTVIFSLHALTLALFSADPDDTVYPLRAARAATALRTALTASTSRTAGAPLSARTELRTAIATGALLVSQSLGGGRPPRVYGATVKECEALLALATSDGTQVCDRTREETKEHFAYEEIPGTPVRWKLLGTVDPEPAADGDDHQRELDLLQGVMTHSSRWSQPHLISVLSSEEGLRRRMLGKLEHFAASGLDGAQVLTWNCQDAAESGPFGLHRRIISRFAGLSRSDPPWAVRRKVSAAVQRLDAGKSCINWLVARCTSVLETSNRSPERFDADEWRDVWRYFLEAVAHDGPIVLIIDNLHLEDSATRELVGLLARLPGRIPLTVVAGAEPDILRHADWSSDRRFATTVLLDKPSDDELDCSDESCLPIQ
ncbi:BTAD domain-containing putative transcriptional regulator [Streptomyces sp. NPDC001219]